MRPHAVCALCQTVGLACVYLLCLVVESLRRGAVVSRRPRAGMFYRNKTMFIHYILCEYSVACVASLVVVPPGRTNDDVRGGGTVFVQHTHILAPTLRRSCHPSSIRFISTGASMFDSSNVHSCVRININFNRQVLVYRFLGCCAAWKHQGREGRGKRFFTYSYLLPMRRCLGLQRQAQLCIVAPWQMIATVSPTDPELRESDRPDWGSTDLLKNA
jgi:hypothetical protein